VGRSRGGTGRVAGPCSGGGPTARRQGAEARGRAAEARAAAALRRDGWEILAHRLRTPAGEIDLVAERDGLAALIEVKQRPSLAEAAHALPPRQQRRLLQAGECALAEHPEWGRNGTRFDVMVVDGDGRVRRIADALRAA
jgi:putative endonuclease